MLKSEEILKYLEKNYNENTTIQNLLKAAKAVLRGMFIAIESFFQKKKKNRSVPNKKPNTPSKRIRKRTNKT